MSTPHPLYPFLQIRTDGGAVTYEATQEYDLSAFLELIRDRPEVVVPVIRVVLDVEMDSTEKSGAIEFVDDLGLGIDESGGVAEPDVSASATGCQGRTSADVRSPSSQFRRARLRVWILLTTT